MTRIWKEAERLTGDVCFGFRVGMSFTVTNYHAVGYAFLSSSNLREALERMVRYQKLLSTAVDLRLEQRGQELCFDIRGPELPRQGIDAASCALVQICREVSREDFSPLRIELERAEPPCARELVRFFGCEVGYGAGANRIHFSTGSVEETLPRNNPALASASDEVARDYIARMDDHDVLAKARMALIDLLPDGEPSRKRLAGKLHMSERTLARRLGDQDYTFSALVDETRSHLARDYLRQSRFTVTDVAFLLGFSDQSNFARAFKRWTGQSPTEFRLAA
jgi:AraC-like DNA-binding protein